MTPKAYLSQYRLLNREIGRLLEEKARWAALATKATPSFSQGSRGQGGDRLQLAVEKIAEWEEKIDGKVDVLVELRQEIEGKLAALPDPRFQEILHRRYILGQKWEQIAAAMNFSIAQVYRIHGGALLNIGKMIVNDS